MKVEELVKEAESEMNKDLQEFAVERIKEFNKDIRSAKKTLKLIEDSYTHFLSLDVEDLEDEVEGFEY